MNLKKTILMFDDTKLEEKTDSNFSLICARPKYKTSDDYFVVLSKDVEIPSSCLFVTSDKELRERLKENGVKICSPKKFMLFTISILGGSVENTDKFFDGLIEKTLNEKDVNVEDESKEESKEKKEKKFGRSKKRL